MIRLVGDPHTVLYRAYRKVHARTNTGRHTQARKLQMQHGNIAGLLTLDTTELP